MGMWEAERWLSQAEQYLAAAAHDYQGGFFEVAAFLAHQAVEFGLKAVVAYPSDRMPPRTHDLMELAELARVPETLRTMLSEMTPDYQRARYATKERIDPQTFFTREKVEPRLAAARAILDWVKHGLEHERRAD